MMNTLSYKGYTASINFDPEDKIFFGRIAGIRDIITFDGKSVSELISFFEEAVNDYLETCEKLGHKPNKPYSGKLVLQVSPEIHAAVAMAAEVNGKSINQWTAEALSIAAKFQFPNVGAMPMMLPENRNT